MSNIPIENWLSKLVLLERNVGAQTTYETLERAGFAVLNLYGSLKCGPFVLGSDELLVVALRS